MRTTLVGLTLLAAACTSVGAASDSLRATVSPKPTVLRTNVWTPTVTVTKNGRPATARIVLRIRNGTVSRAFKARAMRRGSYRVRVAFPADGRWSWTVAAGKQTVARGAITVSRSVRFQLPFDLAVAPDGSIYFVDRGRVLVFDPQTRRVGIYATTQSNELVGIVRARDGTLYLADITGNRILRVDTARRVTVVAPIVVPGDLTMDANGTTLWAGSIENGVFRIDIASGRVDLIDNAIGVHGIDRDRAGNLYVLDANKISRIDAVTGEKTLFADVDAGKILAAPDGTLYAGIGGPAGGQIVHVFPNGTVTPVVGTGSIGAHADGLALEAAILPAATQFAPDGALLVTQTQPIPAIRRVDLATGRITTLARGD